jgi:nitrous oxide reductase accessory protein NosL
MMFSMANHQTLALRTSSARLPRVAASIALILVAVMMAGVTGAVEERPFCEVCRRYTDSSPSRVQAQVQVGRVKKVLDACSLFCLYEMLELYEDEPDYIFVIDHATYGTENQRTAHAKLATYLYDTDGDEEKMHEPFTLAFSSKEDAKAYQEELGGEVMGWEAVREIFVELAADWEPPRHHYYGSNKRGNR